MSFNKLEIAQRRNLYYIKFKARDYAMKIMYKFLMDLGYEYFDEPPDYRSMSLPFDEWKDQVLNIKIPEKQLEFDIICGDSYIHLLVRSCNNWDEFNQVLEKYAEWADPKLSKKVKSSLENL